MAERDKIDTGEMVRLARKMEQHYRVFERAAEVAQEIHALAGKLTATNKALEEQQAKLQKLNDQVAEADRKAEAASGTLKAAEKDVAAKQAEIANLEKRQERMEASLKEADRALEDYKTRSLRDIEHDLEARRRTNAETIGAETRALTQKRQELQAEVAALEKQSADLKARLAKARQEMG